MSEAIVYRGLGCTILQVKVQQGSFINYNYAVVDDATRRAVMIDPAWDMDRLLAALDDHGCMLDAVLLTHSHPDHVHLCRDVADHFACPILMHEAEVRFASFRARRLETFGDLQTLFVGRSWITPIHTPGHTPGSTCFLTAHSIVTGDTLFNEGCGVCHLPGGDAQKMYDSLHRLCSELPGHTRVLPAHAFGTLPGLQLSEVMKMNLYLQIRDRTKFVDFRMQAVRRKSMEFI